MPEPRYLLAAVLTATAITWTLRALPFALLAPMRNSGMIRFLGDHSPARARCVGTSRHGFTVPLPRGRP
jgi:hypothetical protein